MTDHMQRINADILSKYRSFETPLFSFAMAAIEAEPYRALVEDLRSIVENGIKEDTDPNYDVSFAWILQFSTALYILRLSMVGAYAALIAVDRSNQCRFVSLPSHSDEARRVFDLLARHSVELLSADILAKPTALVRNGKPRKTCSVYEALFEETDVLPGAF